MTLIEAGLLLILLVVLLGGGMLLLGHFMLKASDDRDRKD